MTTEADLRLADLIRVYDDALDPELCASVIELFESDREGQFQRGRQNTWVEYIITRNPKAEWREIERLLVENMIHHLKDYSEHPAARVLGLKAPRAFEHLKIKKYRAGEDTPHHFPRHVDAYDKKTAVRMLGFLWYLNTVEEGGETVFPVIGTVVKPCVGRLVLLPPMWMYEHLAEPPVTADKYVVTSYLNIQDPEDAFRFSYPLR